MQEPNHAIQLTGMHVYAEKSVAAGEAIHFHVSSDRPYNFSVVRLGWDTDQPSNEWVISQPVPAQATPQSIRPGSYIHVEKGLEAALQYQQLTLECWVRPFVLTKSRGLITQCTRPTACGFGLFLEEGLVQVYFGSGGEFKKEWLLGTSNKILDKEWNHIAAVFDAGKVKVFVNGNK